MVRRDGVRMENNDSMPDICRRGRDKINSPLNPLWKKSHRLPGINIRKKKEKEKNTIRQTMLIALCQKTRKENVIFSRPVGHFPQRIEGFIWPIRSSSSFETHPRFIML